MQYLVEIDGGAAGDKYIYIAADSPSEALHQAQAWAAEGDWDTSTGTIWVSVRVLDDDGNALAADDNYAINPPEPPHGLHTHWCPPCSRRWSHPNAGCHSDNHGLAAICPGCMPTGEGGSDF